MPLEQGRVVASFGRTVQVEDERCELIDCAIFGRHLEIVCADRVRFERPAHDARGVVREVLPRQSLITRINSRGEGEPVAANATQLVVVIAHPPLPDFFLVDRYLAAAESAHLSALIVLNKVDAESARSAECREELATWRQIGYASVQVSAHSGAGLEVLKAALRDHTSLLVGQSGVGKSSILNALAPQAATRIREIVVKTGKGSHTTTRTGLYKLPGGGELLDSPGVRDFAPGPDMLRVAAQGFREIIASANACRFADCHHAEEPDCAVRAAVESGQISKRRYRSYGQLRDLLERLTRKRRGY
jgi:ribosome biogenesis GTPase / thiamine phosphate phosphatase